MGSSDYGAPHEILLVLRCLKQFEHEADNSLRTTRVLVVICMPEYVLMSDTRENVPKCLLDWMSVQMSRNCNNTGKSISYTNSGQISDTCSCPETSTLKWTRGGWKGKVHRGGDPRLHNAAFHHSYETCPVVLSRTTTYIYKLKHSEWGSNAFFNDDIRRVSTDLLRGHYFIRCSQTFPPCNMTTY
jgi:hypothetical protein